jgi:hypothetical protein
MDVDVICFMDVKLITHLYIRSGDTTKQFPNMNYENMKVTKLIYSRIIPNLEYKLQIWGGGVFYT